jgi:putative membrane protein
MIPFLITCLVTAASLLIISRLPLGIEVDSSGKAIVAGLVFGVLNAIGKPILVIFTLPITIVTFGLFLLLINPIIFGLAAWLVDGFRLKWGFWSAVLGSVALTVVNSLLNTFLASAFPNYFS